MANNKQKDSSGNAQYAADAEGHVAESGRHTNFAHAKPESNVGPAGAPQTSHGNAGRPIPGGTVGTDGARANAELGMGGAAAGGEAGGSTTADQGLSRQDGSGGSMRVDSAGTLDRVADRDSRVGPADTPEP